MTDRTLTGAGVAGLVWIGVLTALPWGTPPGHMGAALLPGLRSEFPPISFTIQNVMRMVFFLGFGELRRGAGRAAWKVRPGCASGHAPRPSRRRRAAESVVS